jgi:hypothetical protein
MAYAEDEGFDEHIEYCTLFNEDMWKENVFENQGENAETHGTKVAEIVEQNDGDECNFCDIECNFCDIVCVCDEKWDYDDETFEEKNITLKYTKIVKDYLDDVEKTK